MSFYRKECPHVKKTIRVTNARGKYVEKQINYIPVRYIVAAMLTIFSILAIIGIVVALCYFVPYFYLAALPQRHSPAPALAWCRRRFWNRRKA